MSGEPEAERARVDPSPEPEIEIEIDPAAAHHVRSMSPEVVALGMAKLKLAERNMGALVRLRERYASELPFKGLRIAMNLHVTKETAVLVRTVVAGGAEVAITGCNSFSTQDDVAAALASEGVKTFAVHGCSNEEFYKFIDASVQFQPHIFVDDGCDLCVAMHAKEGGLQGCLGGCEQTTSGVIRLKNMEKSRSLKTPMILTNENKTKHLLDNYHGTGQSTWDGIMRATSLFIAGKTCVCVGYGECGKGIALRAKGLGGTVIVTETHPFQALRAVYDGFIVKPIAEAAKLGDFFVTATGSKHVISIDHIESMKDGAVLSNAGQFNYEIEIEALRSAATACDTVRDNMEQFTMPSGKSVFLLGGGNLINLSCAEGHPSEVMATSFLGQAFACELLAKGELEPGCHHLPEELDDEIAKLQLDALGVKFDVQTEQQRAYLEAWEEGVQ